MLVTARHLLVLSIGIALAQGCCIGAESSSAKFSLWISIDRRALLYLFSSEACAKSGHFCSEVLNGGTFGDFDTCNRGRLAGCGLSSCCRVC